LQGRSVRCAQQLDRRSLTNPSDLPSSTPVRPVSVGVRGGRGADGRESCRGFGR
jgi:hypothetical protein